MNTFRVYFKSNLHRDEYKKVIDLRIELGAKVVKESKDHLVVNAPNLESAFGIGFLIGEINEKTKLF